MAQGDLDPEGFRETLAAYPTGVTVVTAIGPDGPAGATASAVTSLSLDPPMMLACLYRGSRTLEAVRGAGRFGINALAAGQERLALRFAAKDPAPAKWEGVEWSEREGSPRLADALMWVACELRDLTDGGDHLIATGTVIEAESRQGMPLIFHRGAYRDLLEES
jgi:3-hydroxy-9,10-secoandrosta-1,3,5(10)-triene-9,17-dione monooxygenase reductase component